jgi:hypothetical protein
MSQEPRRIVLGCLVSLAAGLIGMVLGVTAIGLGAEAYWTYLSPPRNAEESTANGFFTAFILAPTGAVLGGTLGAWLTRRLRD